MLSVVQTHLERTTGNRSCEYSKLRVGAFVVTKRVLTLDFQRPSKRMHTKGFYKILIPVFNESNLQANSEVTYNILFPVLNESDLQANSEVTKEDLLNPTNNTGAAD